MLSFRAILLFVLENKGLFSFWKWWYWWHRWPKWPRRWPRRPIDLDYMMKVASQMIDHMQGWCGILIFDKYTYLASFWYLSLYKYPKYTYEHPKYTYYQNILMKRVSVQKYPKGGPLRKKCELFINIFLTQEGHMDQLECQLGILECWKGKRSPEIPHLLWSLCQTEYPKNT